MNGFLEKASLSARANVKAWRERFPDPQSMGRARSAPFLPREKTGCGVIAEIKRRSPSRGDLMGAADPSLFPVLYAKGGAEAVSVVVEEEYFGGSPELFAGIRAGTSLPLLWKDFVVDPYQIRLAAALGASAVLLIAGMLSDRELSSFMDTARGEGLRSLVEIHGPEELERAVSTGADLIGVNNRDLVSLRVDISLSLDMAPLFPGSVQRIAESGIRTGEDVRRMAGAGYRAVLVGESLVTAQDPELLLRGMVKAGKNVRA